MHMLFLSRDRSGRARTRGLKFMSGRVVAHAKSCGSILGAFTCCLHLLIAPPVWNRRAVADRGFEAVSLWVPALDVHPSTGGQYILSLDPALLKVGSSALSSIMANSGTTQGRVSWETLQKVTVLPRFVWGGPWISKSDPGCLHRGALLQAVPEE